MNDLLMEGECREMEEVSCSDNDSLSTAGAEVEEDVIASDGDLERKISSWRWFWRDQCSGSRALSPTRRHWFVREVIHLTRLAIPLVNYHH